MLMMHGGAGFGRREPRGAAVCGGASGAGVHGLQRRALVAPDLQQAVVGARREDVTQ